MTGRDFVIAAGIAVLVTAAIGYALGLHVKAHDHTDELEALDGEITELEDRTARVLGTMNRHRSALARRQSPLAWAANGGL